MARLVIGVDVGGTKIEAILHDGKKVLKAVRVPTEAHKPYKAVLANIAQAIRKVQTKDVKAIGLATPGYVHDGIVYNAPQSLNRKPIAKDLKALVRLPIVHEHDAKCFALAEATRGAGKGKAHVVGIVVGTGIGAGFVLNEQIYRGAFGAAGEIGHAPFNDHDFEYYASGPGIVRSYKSFGGTKDLSAGDILRYKTKLNLEEEVPSEEESAVMLAQNYTYDTLARLIATMINALNPDIVVLGGGVAKSIDYRRLGKKVSQYALPVLYKHVQIKQFAISDSAGSIGAAMLALTKTK